MNNIHIIMNKRDSSIMTFLRFPLIVLVVFSHNGGFGGYDSMHSIADWTGIWQSDLYDTIRLAVRIFASQTTMQSFFFMSGYLYFFSVREWNTNVFLMKSKKRIQTLLIPYTLWNLIAMLYPVAVHLILGFGDSSHFAKANFYWQQLDWINSFWDAGTGCPYLFPLWYIKDLMIFCLFTPILYPILKYKKSWIVIAILLFIFSFDFTSSFIRYIAFFAGGAYLGIHKTCVSDLLQKYEKHIIVCTIPLYILLLVYNYDYAIGHLSIVRLWNIFGCMFVFVFANHLFNTKFFNINSTLSVTVFFIFCTHNLDFMFTVDSLINSIYTYQNVWGNICFYFAIPLVKVAICIAAYYGLKKTIPSALKILTGGRL